MRTHVIKLLPESEDSDAMEFSVNGRLVKIRWLPMDPSRKNPEAISLDAWFEAKWLIENKVAEVGHGTYDIETARLIWKKLTEQMS